MWTSPWVGQRRTKDEYASHRLDLDATAPDFGDAPEEGPIVNQQGAAAGPGTIAIKGNKAVRVVRGNANRSVEEAAFADCQVPSALRAVARDPRNPPKVRSPTRVPIARSSKNSARAFC